MEMGWGFFFMIMSDTIVLLLCYEDMKHSLVFLSASVREENGNRRTDERPSALL